jgi:hypothetical protein
MGHPAEHKNLVLVFVAERVFDALGVRDGGLEQRNGQQEESCFAVHLSISVNRIAVALELHYCLGAPALPARMPTAVQKNVSSYLPE